MQVHSEFDSIFEIAKNTNVKAPQKSIQKTKKFTGPRHRNLDRVGVKERDLKKNRKGRQFQRPINAQTDKNRRLEGMEAISEDES